MRRSIPEEPRNIRGRKDLTRAELNDFVVRGDFSEAEEAAPFIASIEEAVVQAVEEAWAEATEAHNADETTPPN